MMNYNNGCGDVDDVVGVGLYDCEVVLMIMTILMIVVMIIMILIMVLIDDYKL